MKKLPDEESARAASSGTSSGQYTIPRAADGMARQDPEWENKYTEGPAVAMVVLAHSGRAMGKQLLSWLGYALVVAILVGNFASITLDAGTHYLKVFQVVGTLAHAGNEATLAI